MKRSPNGFVPARGFLDSGMAPRPSFNDGTKLDDIVVVVDDGTEVPHRSLRTPISTYQKHVRYAVFEFQELLDSSSIDSQGWSHIAQTIFRNYKLFDAFVILHGTDSLAYTCSALSFMLQNLGKPVILTGSQAPMLELQNDATDNLLGSLIIAGHFMIPEAWDLIYRPTHLEPFSIQTNHATGDVACLRIFPGIEPRMVEAVLQLDGLKGLVLETFGAGNAPGGPDGALTKVLANAIKKGMIIVNITQCMTGTVSPLYEPAMLLKRAGVIAGHDMTSEAALAKLSYLLAMPDRSPESIVQKMSVSLRGELTEQANMVFEHPNRVLPDQLANFALLGYAISKGDVPEVQKLLKSGHGRLLNEADYSGNTPLPVLDSMNTSSYSNGQGLISMQTSSASLDCITKGHQTYGVWLE
ncbi:MAG: hypothetical protein Q9161_004516 [Pseudevernia consocians]